MVLRIGGLAETAPGSQTVEADFSGGSGGFEECERFAQAAEKLVARNFLKLRLRVVKVGEVHAIDAEIFQAVVELIGQERRRHGVATGGDVFGAQNSGTEIFTLQIFLGIAGIGGVGRDVAAFGGEKKFVARKAFAGEFTQRGADGAFGFLVAIVDGRIDDVDAAFDGSDDGRGVGAVGDLVGLAEIGADADGGDERRGRSAIFGLAGKCPGAAELNRAAYRRVPSAVACVVIGTPVATGWDHLSGCQCGSW